MEPKEKERVSYEKTATHQYVFAPSNGTTCGKCGVIFNDHHHTMPFIAKVFASINGKIWKYASFAVREKYRTEASTWLAEQRKRLGVE
jgi:hypothetical protein